MEKEQLHARVYFIADQPTTKNVSKSVPLVGTQSYKTFLGWLADMSVDIRLVRIYNQSDAPFSGKNLTLLKSAIDNKSVKIVALGKPAFQYLSNLGLSEFYALPHPSGRNRVLNDKEKLNKLLETCKLYIYN